MTKNMYSEAIIREATAYAAGRVGMTVADLNDHCNTVIGGQDGFSRWLDKHPGGYVPTFYDHMLVEAYNWGREYQGDPRRTHLSTNYFGEVLK